LFDFFLDDAMTMLDYMLGGLVLLLLAAASPFIYEQATGEPPCADTAYWAERGYAPLPQNSLPPVAEDGKGGADE